MLWHNFAGLFGMHAVVSCSYRPLFFHLAIYIWIGKNFAWERMLVITPCMKMWSGTGKWQKNISVENFDGENVDRLIKIHQFCQYFPLSKFCAIRYLKS